jgi:hypothetical protein
LFIQSDKSLDHENIQTFFGHSSFNNDKAKKDCQIKVLHHLVGKVEDENFDEVSKSIELLLKKLDGLELDEDSPFIKFIEKSGKITKDHKKSLMKTFMNYFCVGSIRCINIYTNDSCFTYSFDYLKNLLKVKDFEKFKYSWKYFKKQSELQTENWNQVIQYNTVVKKYDEVFGTNDNKKVTLIEKIDFAKDLNFFVDFAVMKSFTDVVSYLLKNNEHKDIAIKKSLQDACANGCHEIVELLLKNINDIKGFFVLHKVCENLHKTAIQHNNDSENYQKCFKALIEKFPSLVHERDSKWNIPLHFAVKYAVNKAEIVFLLQKGSYLGAKNDDGKMPINDISQDCLK